jgi:Protein of unknown function (DUF2950)
MSRNAAINSSPSAISGASVLTAVALLVLCCSQLSLAQQSQTRTFASAREASQALYEAVKNNDEPAMDAILGAGPELTSSGSDNDDKFNHQQFVQKYQQMHRLVREADGTTTLYIGAENWPFPIPLVSKSGKWYFDADAGAQEIVARRIGEDETIALQMCQAMVSASRNETTPTTDGALNDYAHHLIAAAKGSAAPENELFHGYYYRVIPEKPGHAQLVAYPADYRVSGVMTFIVTPDGSVYEKDLGPQTPTLAQRIQGKPTGNWAPVQPGSIESAARGSQTN